jgi:hypothetical protein
MGALNKVKHKRTEKCPCFGLPSLATLDNNAKQLNISASYLAGAAFWPTKHAIR